MISPKCIAALFANIEFKALRSGPVDLSGIIVTLLDNNSPQRPIGGTIEDHRVFVAGDSDNSGPPSDVPWRRRRLATSCTTDTTHNVPRVEIWNAPRINLAQEVGAYRIFRKSATKNNNPTLRYRKRSEIARTKFPQQLDTYTIAIKKTRNQSEL